MRILPLAALCLALSSPAFASTIIFDGGAITSTSAIAIDGPTGPSHQIISDGFVATITGTANNLDFGDWVTFGTTPTTISWALGTSAFASDISSGSMAQVSYTFVGSVGSQFDVYKSHVTGLSGLLTIGTTYFLTLSGANNSANDQVAYWDKNAGPATCRFNTTGFPQGSCGPGGEAFTLYTADESSPVPEPGTIATLFSGLVGLTGVVRRRMRR